MESSAIVDCVLRNVLTTQKSLFGERCTFVKFDLDSENYDWTAGMQSTGRFGCIHFQRDGEVQRSGHLVLKITPQRVVMREFTALLFFNEISFYTRIWPFFFTLREIDHLFPRYYNSLLQYNVDSDQGVIVFENVQARGYLSAPKKYFLDYEHLALMLKKLGEFHAYSYRARLVDPDRFHVLRLGAVETNPIILKEFHGFETAILDRSLKPLLNDPRYSAHHQKLREVMNECEEVVRYTLTGDEQNHTHVFCHGDFLPTNVLFKYENWKPVDLKVVDLANWRFASPVCDLALVLYLNADQEMRERNWDKLIDVYYTSLQSTFPLSEVPSKDSILGEFKTKAMYAFIVASYFLPFLIEEDSSEIADRAKFLFQNLMEGIFQANYDYQTYNTLGGEKATKELINILKDIIDRGYA